MKSALFEALKELGRIVSLAVISYILTNGVIEAAVIYFTGTSLDPMTRTYIIGILTSALRAIDKWLHEAGKAAGEGTLAQSISRFQLPF